MADTVKVDLEQNSKYRVAFDLMEKIASAENYKKEGQSDREYYMRLYNECYAIVGNNWKYRELQPNLGE